MVFIDDIIKLIIPKLSPKLYIKNITDKLIELNYHSSSNESETPFEIDYEEKDEFFDGREYSDIISDNFDDESSDVELFEKENNPTDGIINNRKLEDKYNNNNIETTYLIENDLNEKTNDDGIEDYAEPKTVTESTYIDLREANIFNETIFIVNNSDSNDNNTITNYTNLTEFFSQPLENDDMSFKDSEINTVIYSSINNKGILYSVKEKQTAMMNQPDNDEDEILKNEEKLRNEIYNSHNEISYDEANSEEKINNSFSFNLSKISMESINDIYLKNSIDNEELKQKIFKYFDNFEYVKYNETNNTENKVRILSDENINNKNISEQREYNTLVKKYQNERKREIKRKLEVYSEEYYGMKKFTYEKEFFNYNLLGLVLKGDAICEIEPSTGIVHNYFNLGFSRLNKKFNLATQQTNLHIVIEKLNKMTFDFISLLYQSNKNLLQNNKKYGGIIIDIEKNISNLFEKYFDYSGIFTDSLDNLYLQVSIFTGQFLTDLITLIDEVHSNYTIIFHRGKNDSYEFINEIRKITKNAYINYVKNMVNNLYTFSNQTLSFLSKIEEETNKIEIFQIDLLYDIIDIIYDAKILFNELIKKIIGFDIIMEDERLTSEEAEERLRARKVDFRKNKGLVDMESNGAHSDMDVPLFEKSAEALRPYFKDAAELGMERCGIGVLRERGLKAE